MLDATKNTHFLQISSQNVLQVKKIILLLQPQAVN